MTETYWLERAWLGTGSGSDAPPAAESDPGPGAAPLGIRTGVLVAIDGGRFSKVTEGVTEPPAGVHRLHGLTVPGMANCHSHAFHRALRGRTQHGRGSFWTWRDQMYALADRLDPDTYFDLARAVYREMAAAGFTTVGEFHYLHHGRGGTPYDNPNAMGQALVDAAREAGLRIALLDTLYLTAGTDRPAEGVQLRFSDRSVDGWAARVERLEHAADDDVVVAAAVHSVRAVPKGDIAQVASWAAQHEAPLHVHLSEQVAENEECRAAYGITPTKLLDGAGALGPRTTVVHATHLTPLDVTRLGGAGVAACLCPTTERDLGDGIGPSRALHQAGARLTLGTDSHAFVDPFEEMRAVELHERLATQRRGHWTADELLVAATSAGHASLGFEEAGVIAVGAAADLVTLDTSTVSTAGAGASAETAVFAARACDVVQVVANGRVVARDGDRAELGRELDAVIAQVWGER